MRKLGLWIVCLGIALGAVSCAKKQPAAGPANKGPKKLKIAVIPKGPYVLAQVA